MKNIRDVRLNGPSRINDFVNLYECELGENVMIGPFVEIQCGVTVGNRCKISSHSFLCEGVRIEDDVFIGHGVMFTNDVFPRATNADGTPITKGQWDCIGTVVRRGASIGTGVTILPGVEIGEYAMVGAGSVVTKSIPPYGVAYGNPAKVVRYLDHSDRF